MPPLNPNEYAALPGANTAETSFTENVPYAAGQVNDTQDNSLTLTHYLLSIIFMPISLRIVCLTNLFCWMAHVSYSLYFTDFVGEAVYGGDPKVSCFQYTLTSQTQWRF